MNNDKGLDINKQASNYVESKRKVLRSLVGRWDDLAGEAPQKFMQLIKSGMKPKIERGNGGPRQLSVNLSFEMNTDAAKEYISEVKDEILEIRDEFTQQIQEIDAKLQYFTDAGIEQKEFTTVVRLFSDFVTSMGSCKFKISNTDVEIEVPEEVHNRVKYWKEADTKKMREKEAERLGIDVKDLDNHKKYLEAKRKQPNAKTSAAMNQVAKQFASISSYLDAATLQKECEEAAKVLKEKEDEAQRIRLAEEERRRKEEEARKAEEERQRKEKVYTDAIDIYSHCTNIEEYQNVQKKFAGIKDYKDAKDYIEKCKNQILELNYVAALTAFNEAKTEDEFNSAKELFAHLNNYKDATTYIANCENKAHEVKCEDIYQEGLFAMNQGTKSSYQDAIILFKEVADYKDSSAKIEECEEKVNILQAQEDEAKQRAKEAEEEAKRQAEAAKKAKEAKKKRVMAGISIVSIIVILITIAVPYYKNVMLPKMKYNDALELLEEQKFDEAEAIFVELGSYSDSSEMISETRYKKALYLHAQKEYEEAAKIFDELGYYSESSHYYTDSLYQLAKIHFDNQDYQKAIEVLDPIQYGSTAKPLYQESLYQLGLKQFADGLYKEGYETLMDSDIRNYKDSRDQAKELYYQQALVFYDNKEFDKSNEIFKTLGNYKDSKILIHNHVFTEEVVSELTCEQNGEVNRICTSCGIVENVITEAKGHQYTEATCTEDGACKNCGLVQTPALGHKVNNQVCENCGHIIMDALVFDGSHGALEEDVYTIIVPKGTYKFKITTKLNNFTSRWSIKVNGSEIYFGSSVTKKNGTFTANKTILNDNIDSEIIVKVNGSYTLEITPVNE